MQPKTEGEREKKGEEGKEGGTGGRQKQLYQCSNITTYEYSVVTEKSTVSSAWGVREKTLHRKDINCRDTTFSSSDPQ